MKLSNDKYDFWEIKSISFNQDFIRPLKKQKWKEKFTYRGYEVVSISPNVKSKEIKNVCEYFTMYTWKMIE